MACGEGQEETVEAATARETVTPAREAITPAKETVTPAREAVTPAREAVTPVEETVTPAKEMVTPAREISWWHEGTAVDLAAFLRLHPGGSAALLGSGELGPAMRRSPHSKEAFYLLDDLTKHLEKGLVDWERPMVAQVGSLGARYLTWVWLPVHRPLRMFHSDWLESISRTNWRQVVAVWVPVIIISLVVSFFHSPTHLSTGWRVTSVSGWVCVGAGAWPLLEYTIHRWVFHLQPPASSPFLITLHFALHGLHHKVPWDEGRLLFPPGPASLMAVVLYYLYTSLLPYWAGVATFAGTMLGYLVYDLIHYYLHHGNPKEGSYLYYMKRYHNQHHFSQQTKGFGISSSFWDHVFDTLVRLRKLNFALSWDPESHSKEAKQR